MISMVRHKRELFHIDGLGSNLRGLVEHHMRYICFGACCVRN